jgi:WD40 repeat protein
MSLSIFDLIQQTKGHKSTIHCACFSSDGKYLITGSEDNTIILWSLKELKEIRSFVGHFGRVTNLTFSNDNNFIISVGCDYHLIVWDIFSGAQLKNFELYQHRTGFIGDIIFTNDKMKFSHFKGNYIDFWDISESKVIDEVTINLTGGECHILNTKDQVISHNSRWESEFKSEFVIRDIHSSNIVDSFYVKNIHNSLMIKPSWDDTYLAVGTTSALYIIDLENKNIKHLLIGHLYNITSISFTNDNRFVATGSQDGTVIVWDLEKGIKTDQFIAGGGHITFVIFSPDNLRLFISTQSGKNFIWLFKKNEIEKIICDYKDFQTNQIEYSIDNLNIDTYNKNNVWQIFLKGDTGNLYNEYAYKSLNFTYSSDYKYFAIYNYSMFEENTIQICFAESKKILTKIIISEKRYLAMISTMEYNAVTSLMFSNDNTKLYVFFKSNHYRVYSIETGLELYIINQKSFVISSEIIPNKSLFMTLSSDKCFRIYKFNKEIEIVRMYLKNPSSWLILTIDGKYDGLDLELESFYFVSNLKVSSLKSIKYLNRSEGLFDELKQLYSS